MKLLAFAASLRSGSLNRKLIALAAGFAREEGAQVDLADFREFAMRSMTGTRTRRRACRPEPWS